jgi:hypothetical protein
MNYYYYFVGLNIILLPIGLTPIKIVGGFLSEVAFASQVA